MERSDLQALAREKLDDAALLLAHGRYGNAYYLAGYSVELGLKACIAGRFVANTIPDRAFVNSVYVHDLSRLVVLAGLETALSIRSMDRAFSTNWATVLGWSEVARYVRNTAEAATSLVAALTDRSSGVFGWIEEQCSTPPRL